MRVLLEKLKFNDHSGNWYCSWILATMIFLEPLQDVLSYIAEHLIGRGEEYITLATGSVVFILFLIPAIIRIRVTVDSVLVFFFVFLSWSFSLAAHIEYSGFYYNEAWKIMIVGCSIFCIAKNITDYKECYSIFRKASFIGIVFVFARAVIGLYNGDLFAPGLDYSVNDSIKAVPSAVMFLVMFYDKRKPIYLIVFMLAVALMLFYGGRSSLLCVLIAILLILFDRLFMHDNNDRRRDYRIIVERSIIVLFFSTVVFLVLATMIQINIFDGVSGVPGMRILNLISTGRFLDGSGRWEIWRSAYDYIIQHPFWGSGLLYDRLILADSPLVKTHYGTRIDTVTRWTGVYAHNMFLELLMQYGMIIGLSLCIIIVFAAILLQIDDRREKRMIAMVLISYTFGFFLLSSSVFRGRSFWSMLALASGVQLRRHPIRGKFRRHGGI